MFRSHVSIASSDKQLSDNTRIPFVGERTGKASACRTRETASKPMRAKLDLARLQRCARLKVAEPVYVCACPMPEPAGGLYIGSEDPTGGGCLNQRSMNRIMLGLCH